MPRPMNNFGSLLGLLFLLAVPESRADQRWTVQIQKAGVFFPEFERHHYDQAAFSCLSKGEFSVSFRLDHARFSTAEAVNVLLRIDGASTNITSLSKDDISGDWASSKLPSWRARNLVAQLAAARTISWSANSGPHRSITTRGIDDAMRRLARDCGLPLDPTLGLQQSLILLGHLDDVPTSRLDQATRRAIAAWQRSHGLADTGHLADGHRLALDFAAETERTKLGWAIYADPQGRFVAPYLSTVFAPPEEPSGGWNAFATTNEHVEYGIDVIESSNIENEFASFADRFDLTDEERKALSIVRNKNVLILFGSSGDRIFYVRVERKSKALIALQISHDKYFAPSPMWRRFFLAALSSL